MKIELEHNGKTYLGQIGLATGTHFGYEDHGILSVNVEMDFGGSVQGTGHYSVKGGDFEIIEKIMRSFQVSRWEDIKGKQVVALREQAWGFIRGLASLDGTRIEIFNP